jgi:putative SOS response-associated peptidase YedK
VIFPPEKWSLWLGEDPAGAGELKAVFRPYPAEDITMWPVSTRVGNVRNNDPSLIEPMELTPGEASNSN